MRCCFFFQAEDGIRDVAVTGVQTCALPISRLAARARGGSARGPGPAAAHDRESRLRRADVFAGVERQDPARPGAPERARLARVSRGGRGHHPAHDRGGARGGGGHVRRRQRGGCEPRPRARSAGAQAPPFGYRMSHPRQWTVGIGIVTALVFGTALVIKIRPQIDLVAVGSRAPGFRATSLATGRRVTLADYRGTVVLLNVWATWCQPCRVEMPSMERLHQRLGGGEDFKILAGSVDEGGDSVVAAVARR